MKFHAFARILTIAALVVVTVLSPLAPAGAAGLITVVSSQEVFGPANNLIPTLDHPRAAVVNPSTNHLVVANWFCDLYCTLSSYQDGFGELSFNEAAIIPRGRGFNGDSMLAFNPRTNHVWAARETGDFNPGVWADTPSGLEPVGPSVTIDAHLTDIAVNPTTNHVFFSAWTETETGALLRLYMRVDDASDSLNPTVYNVSLDGHFAGGPMAANPHTNHLYVLNTTDGSLEVFRDESFVDDDPPTYNKPTDAVRHVLTIPDIGIGRAIAVNPTTGTIFIATADGIVLLRDHGDSFSVGSTLAVGVNPTAIAVDASAGRVYVANAGGLGSSNASVSIIEDRPSVSPRVLGSPVPLPSQPTAITVNPVTNHVFVILSGTSQIAMLGDLVPTSLTADTAFASTTDETVQLSANVWLGPASDGIPATSTTGVVTFKVLTPDRTGQIGELVAGGVFSTGRSVVTFEIPPGTPPGAYPVEIKYGDSTQTNGFSQTETSLVISQATLNAQADDVTWIAGAASQPPFTYTISGFADGDDESIVGGEVTFSTDAPAMPRVGEYGIEISGSLSAPGYMFSYSPGTLTVAFSDIEVSPASAQVGADSLDLIVSGAGFGAGMAVRWNGVELPTTVASYTELRATAPAAMLASQGVGYVDVIDNLGGSTSPLAPVFVTTSGATITDASIATSDSPSGSATAIAGGTTATASGSGTIAGAEYASNPGGDLIFSNAGGYFDVNLASESAFDEVTVTSCDLGNGRTIAYWWDGSRWQIVSDQLYDAVTGCITMTITDSTSPSLSQLTGTPFGLGGKLLQTIDFPALDGQIVGGQPVTLAAIASSELPVSYAAGPASVCAISGEATVTLLGVGTCTVTASQAGNDMYEAAPDVQRSFAISYGIRALYDPTRAAKSGSTYPIKVALVDASGAVLSSSDLTLTVVGISPDLPDLDVSGDTFTYDPELGGPGGGYQFDLKTKGFPPGTYELLFTVSGDPAVHTAIFEVQ